MVSQIKNQCLDDFVNRVHDESAVVSIIGLGYVGLPLAVVFAEAGFKTIGIDLSVDRVSAINLGQSPIQGIPNDRLKSQISDAGNLSATTDFDVLEQADAVIVCVPTPLSKTHDPDVSYIVSATNEIAKRLHPGMLIVLESTSYPGTTEELLLPALQQARNESPRDGPLVEGQDFFLAFSPERIDPGRTDYTVSNTPKVIGGQTPSCQKAALALYSCVVEEVVPVSSPRIAETVKLLENTFRAVNIGLVNEFAIMCDHLDVNVWEVIDAAKTKPFGYMPFYPGPGLGGHCIPIDPHYLAWKLRTLNYTARFIQLATEVNFGMPEYWVTKVQDALNEHGKALKGSNILVLGVTYKADVADIRESPALDIIDNLREKGAKVQYHDPYVPTLSTTTIQLSCIDEISFDETLRQADCVIVVINHSSYRWEKIERNASTIVDTRNALGYLKQASRS